MRSETREKVKEFLFNFAKEIIEEERKKIGGLSIEKLRHAYPFHSLFFKDEGLLAFKLQRSIVTKMGKKLYPRLALYIARDRYNKVYIDHKLGGVVPEAWISGADKIVDELRQGKRRPNTLNEWNEIISLPKQTMKPFEVVADLYIEDHEEGPLFMEIKSPLPNLDVCAESKRKMLYFKVIAYITLYPTKGKLGVAYLGLPYNPFMTRESYLQNWQIIMRVFDVNKEVLIGKEMWDKIGGPGAFNELLKIIDEVREEVGKVLKRG
jgi:hypothetical protein